MYAEEYESKYKVLANDKRYSPAVSRCSFRHSQQYCASCHKIIAADFRWRV